MNKIRLGVIGCGGMAGAHAQGYKELADQLMVTAVCDVVLERAQAAKEAVGAELAVTDYRDLLEHVDAVLIVLPHDLHYEVGMVCLQAGKHVLMEKPLCNTEQECLELIRTADENNRLLMTAYPVRHWPLVTKMKELIAAKAYGECFQLSIWTEQFTKYDETHWAHSAERLGGGQLFSHGCHYIDIMLWFLGRPVRGLHMGTNFGTPWMEREGTSNVVLEFESGAVGYHFGTWGARGSRLGYSIHAHCTEGMLEMNLAEGKLYAHTNMKAEQANMDTASAAAVLMELEHAGKLTHYELEHFLDCVRTGNRPVTDGPTSLQGLRLIWRLYEAERNHTVADLRGLGLDDDWLAPEAFVAK
ncbi:Gfo/Idh/MocA family protein [Paenibacillus mendelii]|uniref:Gfo/Idh/MocA family protein n=1 Tax=Paenibacillus mendelii TaxID=206163 RepID=A0ABV6JA41_9BACL|nr:Gfo/Idh/MocA family oxidoreductase [Paenibacillus mendelii]MCQ6560965.1 Gfo/Idh/MocA family oxidoreductase [Paenibacillus mendelii]